MALLLAGAHALAAAEEAPAAAAARLTDAALRAVNRAGTEDLGKLASLVGAAWCSDIDVRAMAAAAVGPRWVEADEARRDALVSAFGQRVMRHASQAFLVTEAARHRLVDQRLSDDGRAELLVEIASEDMAQAARLTYRLQAQGGAWRVVDLSIMGVSMVEGYRRQFAPAIARAGLAGLVDRSPLRHAPAPVRKAPAAHEPI